MLLSSRLSLIIAAAAIGLRLGVLDQAETSAIILVAIVTSTVTPALFTRLYPKPLIKRRNVVIIGAGQLGRMLAKRLVSEGMMPVLIEADEQKAATAREQELPVILGSGLSVQALAAAGTLGASAFVATTPDDDTNLNACLLARQNFNVDNLVARVGDYARVVEFSQLGIRAVSRPESMSNAMSNLVLRPDIFQILAEPAIDSEFLEVPLQ